MQCVKISAIMMIAARVTLGLPPQAYAARYAMVMQPPRLMTNMHTGPMSISKSIVIEKGLDDAGAVGGLLFLVLLMTGSGPGCAGC